MRAIRVHKPLAIKTAHAKQVVVRRRAMDQSARREHMDNAYPRRLLLVARTSARRHAVHSDPPEADAGLNGPYVGCVSAEVGTPLHEVEAASGKPSVRRGRTGRARRTRGDRGEPRNPLTGLEHRPSRSEARDESRATRVPRYAAPCPCARNGGKGSSDHDRRQPTHLGRCGRGAADASSPWVGQGEEVLRSAEPDVLISQLSSAMVSLWIARPRRQPVG